LTNVCDVALLADFTSGRTELLRPGQKAIYEDSDEYPTDETWDFVEWGWFKDEDVYQSEVHNWAIEGF